MNGVELSLELILIGTLVALLIGFSKGGFGVAVGGFSTSLLALVLPAHDIIGLLLPILMIADLFALRSYWRSWSTRHLLALVPGAVVGILIGMIYLVNVSGDILRLSLGVVILLLALFKLFDRKISSGWHYQNRRWHGCMAGTTAGFSSALAHAGGPPISVYLLYQNLKPTTFVATSVFFFTLINWIKVPFYFAADLFDADLLLSMSWMLPILPIGIVLGKRLAVRISLDRFNRIIGILLLVAGLLLILG